jgi:AAA+ ATPase superfamily predicted ATPase
MAFADRKRELEALEKQCASGVFEMALVSGRTRAGKTALLTEFIRNRQALFFTARETNARENLAFLSRCLGEALADFGFSEKPGRPANTAAGSLTATDAANVPAWPSYEAALDRIFAAAEGKRLVFIIDDYPGLAASWPGIDQALRERIETRSENCALFLILTSPDFTGQENLKKENPLAGLVAARYQIEPFDFFETLSFLRGRNPLDVAAVYAITGGVPGYLHRFAGPGPLREKIIAEFLTPQGFLLEEPENLLRRKLREPANYNALLAAIASGAERVSDMASRTGLQTGAISHLLDTLLTLGIVEKETPLRPEEPPLTEAGAVNKKPVYLIADKLFAFWYRFIPGLLDCIRSGNSEKAWEGIKPGFGVYLESVFQEICRQYLIRENAAGKLPFFFQNIGRARLNPSGPSESADHILLAVRGTTHALFCRCLWQNGETGRAALDSFLKQTESFPFEQKHLIIFSKAPFSPACRELAAGNKTIRLITFKEMCG